jgi:hypothetical protein
MGRTGLGVMLESLPWPRHRVRTRYPVMCLAMKAYYTAVVARSTLRLFLRDAYPVPLNPRVREVTAGTSRYLEVYPNLETDCGHSGACCISIASATAFWR